MTTSNINVVKLQQAITEFGSLQAATEAIKVKKKAFEIEISVLANKLEVMEKDEAQSFDNIKRVERIFEEREQELDDSEKAFRKFKQDADEFIDSQKQFIFQYFMVESFVAMLRTSPSSKGNIKKLAGDILIMGEAVWKLSDEPHKLRWLFVHTVLGEHLYCYRCINCGLKFIANQEIKSHMLGYYCPNCGFMSPMAAGNSFLEAMLNSSEPSDANEAQDQER